MTKRHLVLTYLITIDLIFIGPTSIQDFSVKRQVFATLIDWKLSVWSCKDQKDSARKAMVSIPVTRDTCILEDSEDCITITNGSCTWIVNPEKDVKVSEILF